MSTVTATLPAAASRKPSWWSRQLRAAVHRRLADLAHGELVLEDEQGHAVFGNAEQFPLRVTVTIRDPDFYGALVRRGSLGAAESYMDGGWSCDDLVGLVRLLVRNRATLEQLDGGLARLAVPLLRLAHVARRNHRDGSRRNIAAHYDLGNDFFRQFLDPTMMYSAAIFPSPEATLEEASLEKIDRICRKLDLGPADHLLEIGTGWGSFAVHAAREFGCRVTTTTISQEQAMVARERVREAGLEGRVEVLEKDYRDLEGSYDKIVSIEMIEAVGWQYYDTFFECCSRLLKQDGMLLLQAIIIADQQYDQARRSVDFIQRYVFPGSCIPSISALGESVARATDMRLFHLEDLTSHYVRTLQEWRRNFTANLERIRELGYPPEFVRMWEYYLCYCEGGFEERAIGDVHMLFTKPLCRRDPILPGLDGAGAHC